MDARRHAHPHFQAGGQRLSGAPHKLGVEGGELIVPDTQRHLCHRLPVVILLHNVGIAMAAAEVEIGQLPHYPYVGHLRHFDKFLQQGAQPGYGHRFLLVRSL